MSKRKKKGVLILGVDPGFASIGFFVARASKMSLRPLYATCFTTKAASKKRRLNELDDDDERLIRIDNEIKRLIEEWRPDVVASEYRVRARNPKTSAQCAMMYAAVHLRARDAGVPFLTYAPEDIKERMTGKRGASKAEVIAALKRMMPNFDGWPVASLQEHVGDAGGVCVLASDNPLVQAILRERS